MQWKIWGRIALSPYAFAMQLQCNAGGKQRNEKWKEKMMTKWLRAKKNAMANI